MSTSSSKILSKHEMNKQSKGSDESHSKREKAHVYIYKSNCRCGLGIRQRLLLKTWICKGLWRLSPCKVSSLNTASQKKPTWTGRGGGRGGTAGGTTKNIVCTFGNVWNNNAKLILLIYISYIQLQYIHGKGRTKQNKLAWVPRKSHR